MQHCDATGLERSNGLRRGGLAKLQDQMARAEGDRSVDPRDCIGGSGLDLTGFQVKDGLAEAQRCKAGSEEKE